MIVNVSRKPETDIERAVRTVRQYYRTAMAQNAIRPGFIRDPAAWALYQAWREADERSRR